VTAFHETTTTILKYILDEQRHDLSLAQRRLDKADEATLKTDAERERFPRILETFRNQITELTDVVADFERLIQHVADANTADSTIEAYVDVADAERYAQRDEYVNGTDDDAEAESEAAQEAWIEQGERAVDEALDALDSEPYGVGFEPRAE